MRNRRANVAFLCCDKALAGPLVGLASSLASNELTNPRSEKYDINRLSYPRVPSAKS